MLYIRYDYVHFDPEEESGAYACQSFQSLLVSTSFPLCSSSFELVVEVVVPIHLSATGLGRELAPQGPPSPPSESPNVQLQIRDH